MSGIESLVPPFVAVGVALVSKRVTFALFAGIWLGGIIFVGGNPITGLDQSFTWMVEILTDDWNARFLLLIALLGSGAAFVYKIGGSHAVAARLSRRITTGKQAQLLTYGLGLLVFFNDYINTVIVGNAARDITAKHRVSTEKLAYLIDSTAAPIATIAPISDWIGYQVALIATIFVTLGVTDPKPYTAFLGSIPWNFYCILTVAAVPTIVLLGRDFGPMNRAEARASSSGQLVADGDVPLSDVDTDLGSPFDPLNATIWHFILPVFVLIIATIWGIWWSAGGTSVSGVAEALENTDVSYALLWGAFAMTVTGIALARARRIPLSECEKILLLGFRTMLPALIIMILAWTIAATCNALDTSGFIISVSRSWMSPAILPILVFLIAATISFTTGTSWGTMAILTPIAVPVAYSLFGTGSDFSVVHIAIGAIFSGAVFGDHCSPISDTTVMSSIFAGADHVAHVSTQIPYALVPATISGVLYLMTSLVTSALPLLIGGLVIQYIALRFLVRRSNPADTNC
jgi:Na+/H+ antiporter NhaC